MTGPSQWLNTTRIRPLRVKAAVGVAFALTFLTAATAPPVLAGGTADRYPAVSQVATTIHLGQTGQSQVVHGVTVTLQQLRSRQEPAKGQPRDASPRRAAGPRANPPSSQLAVPPAQSSSGRNVPQTLVDEILGPQITDTPGYIPPDTMGAVGPTQ